MVMVKSKKKIETDYKIVVRPNLSILILCTQTWVHIYCAFKLEYIQGRHNISVKTILKTCATLLLKYDIPDVVHGVLGLGIHLGVVNYFCIICIIINLQNSQFAIFFANGLRYLKIWKLAYQGEKNNGTFFR